MIQYFKEASNMKQVHLSELLMIILSIAGHRAMSIPVNKFHNTEDFGTVFIETEQKYNWFQASTECQLRNMSLIALNTPAKSSALTAILRKNNFKINLWIGAYDLGEEGHFVWSSTGKRLDFSNWSKGNPDNYNNVENCALIWDITDFEWNDGHCVGKYGFICEQDRFLLAAQQDLQIKKQFLEQLFAI